MDDDASLNRFAERVLPRNGFDVTAAADATEAMAAIAGGRYDVMVVDQRLPDAADLDFLRQRRIAGDRTPAVVLTGFGSPQSAVEAATLGVVDYLVKPVHTRRIVAAIRHATRMRSCEPTDQPPAVVLHPGVSLALVSALFCLDRSHEHHLRTQLAWAVADDGLSFVELVAAVEALGHVVEPGADSDTRRHVSRWLRRAIALPPSRLSPEVQAFVRLLVTDNARARHIRNDALASEIGVSLAELSRLVYEQLGIGPDRCRLIAYLQPALHELAHSDEQVAQIGYRLGQNLPSGFDTVFKKLWSVPPKVYREFLAGSTRRN